MEENTTVSAQATEETAGAGAQEGFGHANVFAFGPEPGDAGPDSTAGADSPGEGAAEDAKQQDKGAASPSGEEDDRFAGKDQKDIGGAFRAANKRLEAKYRAEYEKKLASDPIYQAGRRMIDSIMQAENLSEQDAISAHDERMIAALARQNNVSPELMRMIFRQAQAAGAPGAQAEPAAAPDGTDPGGEPGADEWAADVVTELNDLAGRGALPQGFDLDAAMADAAFAQLLIDNRDFPVSAVCRIYQAERRAQQAPQDVAEKLRGRQKLPQSSRSQQAVSPEINYMNLSDEEFLARKKELMKNW